MPLIYEASQAPLVSAIMAQLKLSKIVINKAKLADNNSVLDMYTNLDGDLVIEAKDPRINLELSAIEDLTGFINGWLRDSNPETITIDQVIRGAFNLDPFTASHGARARIGNALAKLGWQRGVKIKAGNGRQFTYRRSR